ncbi:MAG TPA: MFS transporter [Gaiellaceae bacterium]|jgi:MFS family permease|nr:MFS transporter [Gaiellaceae bacterium]
MIPEALRLRDFRRVFLAQLISTAGDFLVPVAISFAVLDLTGSVSDLGLVLFARILGQVLLFLAGGVWADRLPRQQVMVASNAVRFFSQGLLGVLLVSGHAQIWQLVALQLVHGAATGVFRPAATGLTPQLVPASQLQAANGLMYLTLSIGGIVGPAVGGVLVATVGAGWAIIGDALTFAVSGVLLARIQPLGHAPRPRESFWRELAGGWREVRSRTWLWASIVDFAAFQMIYLATMMVLGPLVAKQSLGGAGAWAAILVAFSFGTLIGNAWSMRLRPKRPLVFAWTIILLCGPSLVLLAFRTPAWTIALTEIGSGLSIGVAGTLWETTLQRNVPPEALSRVSAYDWMGSTALRPLGLAIVGPIAETIGVKETLLAAFALTMVSSLTLLAIPGMWRITADSAAERPGVTPDETLGAAEA